MKNLTGSEDAITDRAFALGLVGLGVASVKSLLAHAFLSSYIEIKCVFSLWQSEHSIQGV